MMAVPARYSAMTKHSTTRPPWARTLPVTNPAAKSAPSAMKKAMTLAVTKPAHSDAFPQA